MDKPRPDSRVATASLTAISLHHYFADEQNTQRLYGILHSYVLKAGIVQPTDEAERDATYELLQDVVLKALELANRADRTNVQPWLLNIASNLLKQKKEQMIRRNQHESAASDLYGSSHLPSEEDFFEQFTAYICSDPGLDIEEKEQLSAALSSLSVDEQRILNLHIHDGFNHNEIAQQLGIKPIAARVRFSRALDRLREAWAILEDGKRGDSYV
jgi:RNA polymerase sigma factor (sigma-70 family)